MSTTTCEWCEGTGCAACSYLHITPNPAPKMPGSYNVTCSKCDQSFSSQADYLTHVLTGYPCGPVAR